MKPSIASIPEKQQPSRKISTITVLPYSQVSTTASMLCSGYVVSVAGLEAAAAGNGGVPRHRLSATAKSLLDVHLAEVADGMLESVALLESSVLRF